MESFAAKCHRLQQCELFHEWSRAHKKDFDGLLYRLTGPLSPTAEPAPEIRLPVQVRPHLVCYLVCYLGTDNKCSVPAIIFIPLECASINKHKCTSARVLVICGNAESNLRNEFCGSRLRNGG